MFAPIMLGIVHPYRIFKCETRICEVLYRLDCYFFNLRTLKTQNEHSSTSANNDKGYYKRDDLLHVILAIECDGVCELASCYYCTPLYVPNGRVVPRVVTIYSNDELKG